MRNQFLMHYIFNIGIFFFQILSVIIKFVLSKLLVVSVFNISTDVQTVAAALTLALTSCIISSTVCLLSYVSVQLLPPDSWINRYCWCFHLNPFQLSLRPDLPPSNQEKTRFLLAVSDPLLVCCSSSLCLPPKLTPSCASWILVSLQMVLEACTCKCHCLQSPVWMSMCLLEVCEVVYVCASEGERNGKLRKTRLTGWRKKRIYLWMLYKCSKVYKEDDTVPLSGKGRNITMLVCFYVQILFDVL